MSHQSPKAALLKISTKTWGPYPKIPRCPKSPRGLFWRAKASSPSLATRDLNTRLTFAFPLYAAQLAWQQIELAPMSGERSWTIERLLISVEHNLLVAKLYSLGVKPTVVNWGVDFLPERSQHVIFLRVYPSPAGIPPDTQNWLVALFGHDKWTHYYG